MPGRLNVINGLNGLRLGLKESLHVTHALLSRPYFGKQRWLSKLPHFIFFAHEQKLKSFQMLIPIGLNRNRFEKNEEKTIT